MLIEVNKKFYLQDEEEDEEDEMLCLVCTYLCLSGVERGPKPVLM